MRKFKNLVVTAASAASITTPSTAPAFQAWRAYVTAMNNPNSTVPEIREPHVVLQLESSMLTRTLEIAQRVAFMISILAVMVMMLVATQVPSIAQERTSTGHVYPLGRSSWDHACGGYLSRDRANGGCYFSGKYHTGEDMMAAVGSSVYSIDKGRVVAIYTSNAYDNYGLGAYNSVIFVQHTLRDGTQHLGTYMHVRPKVGVGATVSAGQVIATVGPYPNGNHLHFGIRPGTTVPLNRWGMMPNYLWPSTNGFVNPVDWIRTRYPSGSIIVPATIVPETSSGFTYGGNAAYWHIAYGVGDGGSVRWTYTNGYVTDNWGVWRPNLPYTGRFTVKVFVPRAYATTRKARYEVTHRYGTTNVLVDQYVHYDVWVTLGTFDFYGGTAGSVKLADSTGEAYNGSTKVAWDTVKWEGATSVALVAPATRSAANVVLSTFSANSADNTIGLTFTGELNEVSATNTTNYVVKVDGHSVEAKAATYDKTTNTVTLALLSNILKAGVKATVSYNVTDASSNSVTGTTESVQVP